METAIRKQRMAFVDEGHCIVCGCCAKVCPVNAVSIWKGIMATVNLERCVGCGKCVKECSASVIAIQEVAA